MEADYLQLPDMIQVNDHAIPTHDHIKMNTTHVQTSPFELLHRIILQFKLFGHGVIDFFLLCFDIFHEYVEEFKLLIPNIVRYIVIVIAVIMLLINIAILVYALYYLYMWYWQIGPYKGIWEIETYFLKIASEILPRFD